MPRLPELALAADPVLEADIERIEMQGERLEGGRVDAGAVLDGVVAQRGIGEAAADRDDDIALPPPNVPDGDPDDDPEQRQVEEQVAALAGIPGLGGQAGLVGRRDAIPTPKGRPRGRDRLLRARRALDGRMPLQPLQARRHPRRRVAQGLPVHPHPRQHAAEQADEEQQVDRREPR